MNKSFILIIKIIVYIIYMSERVILCFGYTQTGKSSLIKHLTGDTSIICGI